MKDDGFKKGNESFWNGVDRISNKISSVQKVSEHIISWANTSEVCHILSSTIRQILHLNTSSVMFLWCFRSDLVQFAGPHPSLHGQPAEWQQGDGQTGWRGQCWDLKLPKKYQQQKVIFLGRRGAGLFPSLLTPTLYKT